MSVEIGTKSDRTNTIRLSIGTYPDNTPVVNLDKAWETVARDGNLFMTVRPESLNEFVAAMFVADSFAERGVRIKSLVIPCIPGARQDRLKSEGDWLFTLKSVAGMINARGFDHVVTLDPHSLATTALIDRLIVADLRMPALMVNAGLPLGTVYDGIIAPDLGASKRAQDVAKQFNVPTIQAGKTRDPETNKLSGFKFYDELKPGHYLVSDDLCDAGGTFVGLAQEASKVYGVTMDLFVTHGLFTQGTSTLFQHYNRIFATDSVEINDPRVNTLEVTKGLSLYV